MLPDLAVSSTELRIVAPSFFTKANIIMSLWAFDQVDGSNISQRVHFGSCFTDAPGVFAKRHQLGERFFEDITLSIFALRYR